MHDGSNDVVYHKEVLFEDPVDMKLRFGIKTPKTPNFATGMPNFQPFQINRITFEWREIHEKCQWITHTNSESDNQTVPSFLL
jgi:hypothetical protein